MNVNAEMLSVKEREERAFPRKIPLLDIPSQEAGIRSRLDEAIARVLDRGQYILGPEVTELERRFAGYCGTEFAVSCASGSDALLLPLMALGVKPGDEVITCPFTFFATAGAISRLGATPSFVDIEAETFNLDPDALTRNLESRTSVQLERVKAIIPIHLFGQCADMNRLREVARRFAIPLIEDAAQAIGAEQDGERAGSLGWCGAFSFFPTKNLGGGGDGGMVTTSDPELAAKLRMLRVHGSSTRYYHQAVGINSRLDSIQAAILLVKMDYLEAWNEQRRTNASLYGEKLLAVTPVSLPREAKGMRHVFNQFTVRVPQRDRVRERLASLGVGAEVYYPLPLHLQECFSALGHRIGDFPRSESAAQEVISLPIHPGLTADDVAEVANRLTTAVLDSQAEQKNLSDS